MKFPDKWKSTKFLAERGIVNINRVTEATGTGMEESDWTEPIKHGCGTSDDVCICASTSNCSPELLRHNLVDAFDFKQNRSRGKSEFLSAYNAPSLA